MHDFYDSEDDFDNTWQQAEVLAEEALELYEKGRMHHAFEALGKAIESGPENAAWFFNMGLILDAMERYEEALDYYEKALAAEPDDPEILNCLGVDYTRTAQYDLSLATFEHIEQIAPDFELCYCNRIITYTEIEQHEKAEEMFYLAQQIESDCPLCFYNIGNSLFSRGAYDRAIWCWQKTAALDSGHPQIHYRLAQAFWLGGKEASAREAFLKEIRKNPTDLDVLLDFGVFLLESGDIDAAKEKFNRLMEMGGDWPAAHFYLGEVYRLRDETGEAGRQYRLALEGDGQLAGPRYRLAEILLRQGNTTEAIGLLKVEIKLDIQDADVLIGMGFMFLNAGDFEHSAQCFLDVLDVAHEEPRAFLGLGMALSMRGENAAGRQCIEHTLRLEEDNPLALLNAAWLCCRLEDWQAASVYAARCRALRGRQEPYRSACKEIENQIRWSKLTLRLWK